jgi:putative ABC transport system substrate-binding protein
VKRREFIAGLGGAAAWPVVARAQQAANPVVGFLSSESLDSPEARRRSVAAIHQGLRDNGYVEGRNVSFEYRWPQGDNNRLSTLALELIGRRTRLIIAISTPAALAAKNTNATTPIVFLIGGDPIKLGLVTSLNRPGANVPGVSTMANALGAKNLQFLHELVPQDTVIAKLVNPTNQNIESETNEAQAVAHRYSLFACWC